MKVTDRRKTRFIKATLREAVDMLRLELITQEEALAMSCQEWVLPHGWRIEGNERVRS